MELLSKTYANLDIMTHLIPHLIEKGEVVHAYMTDATWCDVGSTERYEKLDNDLIDNCLKNMSPQK
jgi:NDP-sugar pyrophosphorylase family protein